MDQRLASKLARMYPSCTHRELEELASSLRDGKYWGAQPGFVFAVAVTRARRLRGREWIAEVTGLGGVAVPETLKPLCRKGRVLLVSASGSPHAILVLGWPAFLWAMRKGLTDAVVRGAVAGSLKGYVGVPKLKEDLRSVDGGGLAGPSGLELR
jgi:hypothetical protein